MFWFGFLFGSFIHVFIGGLIIQTATGYQPMEVHNLKLWKVALVGGTFMSVLWLIAYTLYWIKTRDMRSLGDWLMDKPKNPF